jgi:hypothetical protein
MRLGGANRIAAKYAKDGKPLSETDFVWQYPLSRRPAEC